VAPSDTRRPSTRCRPRPVSSAAALPVQPTSRVLGSSHATPAESESGPSHATDTSRSDSPVRRWLPWGGSVRCHARGVGGGVLARPSQAQTQRLFRTSRTADGSNSAARAPAVGRGVHPGRPWLLSLSEVTLLYADWCPHHAVTRREPAQPGTRRSETATFATGSRRRKHRCTAKASRSMGVLSGSIGCSVTLVSVSPALGYRPAATGTAWTAVMSACRAACRYSSAAAMPCLRAIVSYLMILFCSSSTPWKSASGVGGQPGT
jgi:hypothetical protein